MNGTARSILLVGHCAAFTTSFTEQLARYGPVCTASTRQAGLAKLADGRRSWRAILVDYLLPDGNGLDIVLQAKRVHPGTATLLLTRSLSLCHPNAVYALGIDYLEKPIDGACLERFMGATSSMDERIDQRARVWRERCDLSEAQEDVLRRAAHGESRDAIASARGSTVATVKRQICDLLQKTGHESLHSAVEQLIREAAR